MRPEEYWCHNCESLLGLTDQHLDDAVCGELVEVECPNCGVVHQVFFDSEKKELTIEELYS